MHQCRRVNPLTPPPHHALACAARFSVVLQLLDFMAGHAPPSPSWTDTYLAAMAGAHDAGRAADAARKAEIATIAARPGGQTSPPAAALAGYYAHPAYGNCSISVSAGAPGEVPAGGLQVGGCAAVWQQDNARPWVPAFGLLRHLYFSTFAVVGEHLDVGAGTPTLAFHSTAGGGNFDRFESPLEGAVSPIVFVKAGASYQGQGVGYSVGADSRSYNAGIQSYDWPLPRPGIYN